MRLFPKIHLADQFYIFVSTFISSLIGLVLPFSILIIFDRILPNQSSDSLMLIYGIIIGSIVLDYLVKKEEEKFVSKISMQSEKHITKRLYDSICNTQLSQFRNYRLGALLDLVRTIPEIKEFYSGESIRASINLITSIITIALIFMINNSAGLVLVVASIILAATGLYLSDKRVKLVQEQGDADAETNSRVIEVVSNPLLIKARTMEHRFSNYIDFLIKDREEKSVRYESIDSFFGLLLGLIQQLSVALVVVVCATATINMQISQGVMAAVIMLTNRYFAPYQQVVRFLSRKKMVELHSRELKELLDLEVKKTTSNEQPQYQRGAISEIAVSGEKSLSFKIGKVHILQGPGACGKSLLGKHLSLDAAVGLFDIHLNDKELHEFDYHYLSRAVARIDDQSSFIEGTIIDNLTSFQPELNRSAISLCDSLGVKADIDKLRQGFYTALSATSSSVLSRQVYFALLIVRMMLSNNSLLIIDDIDMVLDDDFERALINLCAPRAKQLIILIISNKISSNSNLLEYHSLRGLIGNE
ncbi:ABC transporter transmembrane domain-containing protein [Aliagarivorans marinus]|uniref:ABC transporter transmembrane domain-containing protein n=1 Tax=Aliagarivorans marinus TaxID=561965 RepID=UPI0004081431|nr:ABC transporter transmembrane domain-containing protein [Aliagarivorans marinus]